MIPCRCSTRALELLVKDFTGLTIRQPRPHIQFYQQRRRFRIRPPLQQLEPVGNTSSIPDDAFIPFDTFVPGEKDTTESSKEEAAVGENLKLRKPEELDEEWHAEIEIASPWPLETGVGQVAKSTNLSRGKTDESSSQLEDLLEGEASSSTMDNVAIHDLHLNATEATIQDTTPLIATDTTDAPQRSRLQNRIERKRRRMEAGEFAKYKKASQARGAEVEPVDQTRSVLEKIEALDDPVVAEIGKRLTGKKAVHTASKAKREQKEVTASPRSRGKPATTGQYYKPEKSSSIKYARSMPAKDGQKRRIEVEASQPQPKLRQESWQVQKGALQRKFGEEKWQPRKRLSPDTLEGIRALHASDPESYTTKMLAEHFEVTPEAIRRVLKSKWKPSAEEIDDRRIRWEKRGVKKWTEMAEQGVRPPAKWRAMGIKHREAGEGRKKERWRKKDGGDQLKKEDGGGASQSFAGRIL